MDKKALSQIDWVISLALFIFYLMIFFMFLKPKLMPVVHADVFPSAVVDGLNEDVGWSVYSFPLFVNADNGSLVFVDFPLNASDFYMKKYFSLVDGKLFFIKNESYFSIIYSGENYSKPFFSKKFSADESEFSNDNVDVSFSDFMPGSFSYNSNELVHSFGYDDFGAANFSFYNDSLVADYKAYSQIINHSCFLADDFSGMYCFVSSDKANVESLNFSFIMNMSHDFSGWQTLNESDVLVDGCESLKNISFLNFNGSDDIAFVLNPLADVDFCWNASLLNVTISFNDVSDFSYFVIAHKNEDFNKLADPFFVDLGMVSEQKGISWDKLSSLNTSSYDELKLRWNIPSENDFSFDVFNLSSSNMTVRKLIYSYNESVPSDFDDVYAVTFNDFLLDKFDSLYPVEVVVRAW